MRAYKVRTSLCELVCASIVFLCEGSARGRTHADTPLSLSLSLPNTHTSQRRNMIFTEDHIITLIEELLNAVKTLKTENRELENELQDLKNDYHNLARTKTVTSITVSSSSRTMTVRS